MCEHQNSPAGSDQGKSIWSAMRKAAKRMLLGSHTRKGLKAAARDMSGWTAFFLIAYFTGVCDRNDSYGYQAGFANGKTQGNVCGLLCRFF